MIRFRRADDRHMLAVSMTGVKTGDRFLQIGCGHGARLGAIAARVGLSGRAVAVVADEASAARAQKGAAQAGVLLDVNVAPPTAPLPYGAGAFDVAVIDDTDRLLSNLTPADRTTSVRELFRTLRPGGRLLIIAAVPNSGLSGLFAGGPKAPAFNATPAREGEVFRIVRVLAERYGLSFLEGVKPR